MCRLAAAGEHIDQARSERLRIRGCAFQLGAQQRIAAGEVLEVLPYVPPAADVATSVAAG